MVFSIREILMREPIQQNETMKCTPEFVVVPRGFRIADAAKYMGVTPWYVEEIIRSRELPAIKMGRAWVVLREDLDALLGL